MDPQTLAELLGYGQPAREGGYEGPVPGAPQPEPVAEPQSYAPVLTDMMSVGTEAPIAPEPAVAPTVPAEPPQTVKQSAGTSVGVGGGYAEGGYSAKKNAEIQAGPGAKLARDMENSDAEVDERYKGMHEAFARTYSAQNQAAADKGAAETAKITFQGEASARIAKATDDHNRNVQQAFAVSQAEAEQAKADYRASVLAIPEVNSSQFWESLGTGGQMGMMATAFAVDFLGAKGIKSSGMDSIRDGIKRNMDAQIHNIATKKEVSHGFKTLWDMTRANSATEAEAKDKMYGYSLQSLKSTLDSEMAKYDAPLAAATNQMLRAKLDEEALKNQFVIEKHIDDTKNNKNALLVKAEGDRLQASAANYRTWADLKVAERAATERKLAAEAEAKAADESLDNYMPDVTKSGDNELRWKFNGRLKDETAKRDVRLKTAITARAIDALEELTDLQDQMEAGLVSGNSEFKQRTADALKRREMALRSEIVSALVLDASGKAANDKEREEIRLRVLEKKEGFGKRDNRSILGQTLLGKQAEADNLRNMYMTPVVKGDLRFGQKIPKTHLGEANYVSATVGMQPEKPPSPTEEAEKKVLAPDAEVRIDGTEEWSSISDPKKKALLDSWESFTKEFPNKANPVPGVPRGVSWSDLGIGTALLNKKSAETAGPTKAFVHVGEVAAEARGKNSHEARDKLIEWSQPKTKRTGVDANGATYTEETALSPAQEQLKAYAEFYLNTMKANK